MVQIESYAFHLIQQLNLIEEKMIALLEISTIKRFRNDPNSPFVFITAPYYFEKSDEKQSWMQAELAESFSELMEHIHLLIQNLPTDKKRELKELEDSIMKWIDRSGDLWELPSTIEEAKKVFSEKLQVYHNLLEFLIGNNEEEYIFIPDTNALIDAPDITVYRKFFGDIPYTVVIMPTITRELDSLKVVHRDEKFREKVKSVISRIKGWRNQGNLSTGVTVDKSIKLKIVAKEPNFENTLSWLDKENDDDRLIASALELQRQNINSKVILITSDINLQNKAEAANFPYLDTPDS